MSTTKENPREEEDPVATVLAIEHHLYNMGKALACPLCLSTLKTPTLLPCNHAFCKHCITEYFDPKHNRKIDSASGKHSFKNNCPICKTPASKRGITESEMLVGLVRAYKQALRSFGQTPVVYDETIAMTQIEETVCFSQEADNDDGHDDAVQDSIVNSNMVPPKEGNKKGPTLRDCHQHLEVSRGVHNVLKRAVDSLATNSENTDGSKARGRLEEMEKQNKLRRLNNLLLDQEKVVKVNEKALVRAAVSKQKKKGDSSFSSSSRVSFENNNGHMEHDTTNPCEEAEMDNVQESNVNNDSDDETTMDDTNENDNNDSFTQNILDQAKNAMEKSNYLLNDENSKPEGVCYPQGPETNSQTFFSAPEPEPVNLVGKDEIMTSQECYERAMEDARENEAADRSCEWLDKENEVLTQDIKGSYNDDACTSSTALNHQKDETSQHEEHHDTVPCDRFFSATSQMNEHSQDGAFFKSRNDSKHPKEDHLQVGEIVQVEDRTWPGVNKRGGVARITKVHHGAGVSYDVAYVLGGREKQVDSAFVRLHKEPSEESSSILNVISEDASIKSAGSRKSYRVGEKKLVQEWVAQIEKEEELKAKLTEKSIDDNIPYASKQTDSKLKKPSEKVVKKQDSEKSQNTIKKNKKNKIKPLSEFVHVDRKKSSVPSNSNSTILVKNPPDRSNTSFASIIERSLKTFNSNLQLSTDSNKTRTLYLTTSSIGKAGEELVKQMISELKGGVRLKLLQDFNPYKTSILITTSSGHSSYGGLISKLRTMKTMRSCLSSIPIVSLQWVKDCLSKGKVIPLTLDISVTTLPTKLEGLMSEPELVRLTDARSSQTAALGVLALALLHHRVDEPHQQESTDRLFSNTSVFLCGSSWKSNTTKTKDVQLLLQEGGGDIISSASQAVRYIEEDLVETDSSTRHLVLLCDDSESDTTDGITSNLSNAAHKCLASSRRQDHPPVLVVNMNWLFDSISCASCLDPRLYEPSSPHARSLWNLYFPKELE